MLCSQRVADKLTANDVQVLDALLEAYPDYAMVDNFHVVTRLLDLELIEANVRQDGEIDQAVYRITPRGAEAYRLRGRVSTLERVS